MSLSFILSKQSSYAESCLIQAWQPYTSSSCEA